MSDNSIPSATGEEGETRFSRTERAIALYQKSIALSRQGDLEGALAAIQDATKQLDET